MIIVVVVPQNLRNIVSNQMLTVYDITLDCSNTVRNLGIILTRICPLNAHVKYQDSFLAFAQYTVLTETRRQKHIFPHLLLFKNTKENHLEEIII